jgi:NTP pyrophosphatase (non-canonical NTP hydrolase)
MKINELCKEAHKQAKSKGWYKGRKREIPELIALIHSELSEALEEARIGKIKTYYHPHNNKPEGFAVEIADAVIRIADMCAYFKIDLEEAIRTKIRYNNDRPYRHGNKKF